MIIRIEKVISVEEEDLAKKPDYVSQERWERICRIRSMKDKKRSLLAGKLLDQMCKEVGITDPVYETQTAGKPILLNASAPAFNLSHSGDYVMLGYEEGADAIGVDIQIMQDISEKLKKRILHEREIEWLKEQFSEKEIPKQILNQMWALKESFVKMTGEGLSHDFRKLCIDFENRRISDELGREFPFWEPDAPEGYVAAVVMDK